MNKILKREGDGMKTGMDKILPIFASIGVGIAAYQLLSGNGEKMKSVMPLASNLIGMSNAIQGQNQQQ